MYSLGFHSLRIFPIGNGVKQGGILSPLLFNVYMDDLSLQLHRQPIGCSVGGTGTVINHMLYICRRHCFVCSLR